MALKRTKLLNIQSVTGIATVGIFTAGVTSTAAGVAGTTYIRGVIMHNTGLEPVHHHFILIQTQLQYLLQSQQIVLQELI
jgi:hypothetical protein